MYSAKVLVLLTFVFSVFAVPHSRHGHLHKKSGGSCSAHSSSPSTYTVAAGDTGSVIAAIYSITFDTLSSFNPGTDCNALQAGQVLQIPSFRHPISYTIASGDDGHSIASEYGISFDDLCNANPGVNWDAPQAGQQLVVPGYGSKTTYTCASGDTESIIAAWFQITLDVLFAANPTINWHSLQPGQPLQIPCGSPPKQAPMPSYTPAGPTMATTAATTEWPVRTTSTSAGYNTWTTSGASSSSANTWGHSIWSSSSLSLGASPLSTTSAWYSSPNSTWTMTSSTTSGYSPVSPASSSTSSSFPSWSTSLSASTTTTSVSFASNAGPLSTTSSSTTILRPSTASSSSAATSSTTGAVASTSTTTWSVTTSSARPSTTLSISTTSVQSSISSSSTTSSTSSVTTTLATSATTTTASSSTTTSAGEPSVTNSGNVVGANAVPTVNDSDGVGPLPDKYTFYQGDGSTTDGWPAVSQWISFSDMWNANLPYLGTSCSFSSGTVTPNSATEQQQIHDAIQAVAAKSELDHRLILAVIMQESAGCVRVPTTMSAPTGGHANPGLMQSAAGTGTCNNGGTVSNPCPVSEIFQMVEDGVFGTPAPGDGYVQGMNYPAGGGGIDGAEAFYRAARYYNSGFVPPNGDLGAPGATRCYSSDIANRLMGWVAAPKTCTLDG